MIDEKILEQLNHHKVKIVSKKWTATYDEILDKIVQITNKKYINIAKEVVQSFVEYNNK